MNYDLGCLRVNNTFVPLVEDIHIASIVRLKSTLILKPHSAYICRGKVKNNPQISKSGTYQVSSIEQGFVNNELGLETSNAVIKLDKTGSFPVRISNNTGRTYTLKKGCVIGKVSQITEDCIRHINSIDTKGHDPYKHEEL